MTGLFGMFSKVDRDFDT